MTVVREESTEVAPGMAPAADRVGAAQVFMAILRRDITVTGQELPAFLAQVIIQPLFLLFVFGKILTQLGYARHGYAQVLFPGIVGLTAMLTGLQSTAFPLVIDFSFTKEIEDRLLAPIPLGLVAIEKVVFAALRALISAAVMFPIGIVILNGIPWRSSATPVVVGVLLLGTLTGGALGLVLGTFVPPNRINIMFALILTPILFTGSSQYPWLSLSHLRWFQVISAANPLTYVSEGLRGSLEPAVPHLAGWLCLVVLAGSLVVLTAVGIHGFRRRALS